MAIFGNIWIFGLLLFGVKGQGQHFQNEPDDVTVKQGEETTLRCSVMNRVASVQWTRNKFALGIANQDGSLPGYPRYHIRSRELGQLDEYDLVITNAQLEDDAEFQCQVMATAKVPGIRSRNAALTVYLPPDHPELLGPPELEVVADRPTNVTCRSNNGKPAPRISWFKEGRRLYSSVRYDIARQKSKLEDAIGNLEIVANKDRDHGKTIRCDVTNPALNKPLSVSKKLNVIYPPEVKMTVSPRDGLQEYGTVEFNCISTANPSTVTWKWYQEGVQIFGELGSRLRLSNIGRQRHGKKISCEAENKVGKNKQEFKLDIKFGPRFTQKTTHKPADPGETVTLECHAQGNPPPAISWRKKGDSRILSRRSTLQLFAVKSNDFGVYVCTASVKGFKDSQMDVHLLRKGPPKVISPEQQFATPGEPGQLECIAESVPKPNNIYWSRNGQKKLGMEATPRYKLREEELPNGRRSVLEIAAVEDDDFGPYNCSVANGYGKDFKVIYFKRQDAVSIAYVLAAVLVGIAIIVIIGVVVFIYRRRKRSADSDSESSDADLQKRSRKDDSSPDIKVEYKDPYVETWRQENDRFYRYSAEYDELSMPPKQNYEYRDFQGGSTYGDYGPAPLYVPRQSPNPYGTYPKAGYQKAPSNYGDDRFPADPIYAPPSHLSFHSDLYGPRAGGPRAPSRADTFAHPAPEFPLPPADTQSKLSTNV